ncbi:DUF4214 domain-containing protein [Undibacterium sp. Di26W]|uniref:DUF4214 domain-containing protein n=1 Tax=Undibacterium sp. Di26W TaxID=3413035 RepID=UPI003BF056CD
MKMTITLKIDKIDDGSQSLDATTTNNINAYLAAVALVVNNQLLTKDTNLKVTFGIMSMGSTIGRAGSYFGTLPGSTKLISEVESKLIKGISMNDSTVAGLPTNTSDLLIDISPQIADEINANFSSGSTTVDTHSRAFKLMLHEFEHALGIASARSPNTGEIYSTDSMTTYDGKVSIVNGTPFFIGKTAMAVYGSKVPLFQLGVSGESISHFTLDSTGGIPSKIDATELLIGNHLVTGAETPYYSDLDLAVFRDIGYQIRNTITSLDKHTFIPGVQTTKITGDVGVSEKVFLDGARNSFSLSHVGNDTLVKASTIIPLTVSNIDTIQFDDYTVNLKIGADAKTIPTDQLNKLVQLYMAFFNRVPDAAGLDYWVNRVHDGMPMNNIADSFFVNAQAQSAITGYSPNATNKELVLNVYKNVLNRTTSTVPPDDAGVQYWVHDLDSGVQTKSSLINSMIVAGYADPNTAKVLDNKLYIGKYFAVDQGLGFASYDSTADAKAVAISAAVTSTDYTAALKLIGVSDVSFAAQIT